MRQHTIEENFKLDILHFKHLESAKRLEACVFSNILFVEDYGSKHIPDYLSIDATCMMAWCDHHIAVVDMIKRRAPQEEIHNYYSKNIKLCQVLMDHAQQNLLAEYKFPVFYKEFIETSRRHGLQQYLRELANNLENETELEEQDIYESLETAKGKFKQSADSPDRRRIKTFMTYEQEIIDYHENHGTKGVMKTGISDLDEYYKVVPGHLTIITGIPSHGKSEFLDWLLIKLLHRHQCRFASYSPENYPVGYQMQKFYEKVTGKDFFDAQKSDVMQSISLLSSFIDIIDINISSITPDNLINSFRISHLEKGTRCFVVDPWNKLEHRRPKGMPTNEYVGIILNKLGEFARNYGVNVFVVAHPVKMKEFKKSGNREQPVVTAYDIADASNFYNMADCILSIWRNIVTGEPITEVYIQKFKHKNIGKLGRVYLSYNPDTGNYFRCETQKMFTPPPAIPIPPKDDF